LAQKLWALSWPMALTGFCTVSLPLVSLIFGGRLGREQLAAVGLATMLANVSGASVIQGLLGAFETLGSQVWQRHLCTARHH
jgi:MATE family multidrug resistance protein